MSNMVIRTNVLSLNSHRNLGMTGNAQANASMRLSSGFRINSAADDAAGLAISEKMRSQIRGLDQASRNAQDGISLIQTAEGAMSTINDMVNRIRELVVQAANDTNVHEEGRLELSDRQRIQDEINQILDEIDTVTARTEFNTRRLLDGSLAAPPADNATTLGIQALSNGDLGEWLTDVRATPEWTAYDAARDAVAVNDARIADGNANVALLDDLYTRATAITNTTLYNFISGLSDDFAQAYLDGVVTSMTPDAQLAFILDALYDEFGATFTAANLFDDPSDWDGFSTISTAGIHSGAQVIARNAYVDANWDATAWSSSGDPAVPAVPAVTNMTQLEAAITAAGTFRTDALNAAGGYTLALNNARTALDAAVYYITDGEFSTYADLVAAVEDPPIITPPRDGNALWFQIGANAGQGISLNIESVRVADLVSQAQFQSVVDRINAEVELGITTPDMARDRIENLTELWESGGRGLEFLRTVTATQGGTGDGILHESGFMLTDVVALLDIALAHTTSVRSSLGAVQNRLEFTIENLDIASENLSAANSRIRDADMAREMMRLTQMNVLQQAATAMLAQANQAPQMVLQLLG